jgi:tetraacyldisaccharide 4'-kinase
LLSRDERQAIQRRVAQFAPQAPWLELRHAPQELLAASGRSMPCDALQGEPVAAFCGLGNPAGFRRTLEQLGYRIIGFREFPDHYSYQRTDVDELAAWANSQGAAAVVCTRKDLVKLRIDRLGVVPLWAVTVGVEWLSGREELEQLLQRVVESC